MNEDSGGRPKIDTHSGKFICGKFMGGGGGGGEWGVGAGHKPGPLLVLVEYRTG